MRSLLICSLFLIAWKGVWISSASAEAVIVLPGIIRSTEGVTSITLEGNDDVSVALGKQAFALHGGFHLGQASDAAFIIRLESFGNAARVSVRSGVNASVMWEAQTEGVDSSQALLRGCDRAVEYITGKPGFFAGKLAFVGKRNGTSELFTSDLMFRSVVALTSDKALVTGTSWSPDGKKILCTTYFKSGFPDLYVFDLEAGLRTTIASYKGTNTGGCYSPDGTRIAMVISGSGDTELCVSDARGRDLRRLTRNRSLESGPSWSPDGSELVFTSDMQGKPQLFTMPSKGGKVRRLATQVSRFCTEPSWNPIYADQIAFTAATEGGFQIALYDARQGRARILTSIRGSAVEPTWTNDGRHLIFTERKDVGTRLMLLDTLSGKISPLHRRSFGSASSASFVY
ncbi:MAG: Protein TolB [Opitutia bacterium UBA7350]|nr:MAG: Protein TolB [Opitutae bacterium UBA7350]